MYRFILLILISVLIFQTPSQAQQSNEFAENTIYAKISIIGLGGSIQANYERVFYQATDRRFIQTLATRVGGAYWGVWGGGGIGAITGVSALTGKQKHHLEGMLGAAYLYDKESYDIGVSNAAYFNEPKPSRWEYSNLLPAVSLGYRYQKLEGGFVFRIGAGYPEGAYLGLGYSF